MFFNTSTGILRSHGLGILVNQFQNEALAYIQIKNLTQINKPKNSCVANLNLVAKSVSFPGSAIFITDTFHHMC